MKYWKAIKSLLKRKPKFKPLPTGEVAVEAFRHNGKVYYHFTDSFKVPAGRLICALAIYEELRMRLTPEYIEKHCKAIEMILSDPKKINIQAIAIINNNMKERLSLVPFPDHIYKLASVTFFDETESPYGYEFEYNKKKIEEWKKDPAILDFFLRTQFADLIPFSNSSGMNAGMYFQVSEEINKMHQDYLSQVISGTN
jgi:hypothetical protein